jgi:PAS domain S-box-containing protein
MARLPAPDRRVVLATVVPTAPGRPLGDAGLAQPDARPALAEQFEQLSTIFDSLEAVVYVADLDTHELLYLNAYAQARFGREGLGKPCFSVLQTGQGGPCDFCTNHRLVSAGVPLAPHVWEFRNTVTGQWFQCIDRAIRWTDGRLVRMEVAVDITERKLAEEAVREASQMLEAVVDASPVAICALDLESRVTRWNEAAERTYGWTREEVLGEIIPVIPEEHREEFRVLQERLRLGERLAGLEARHLRRDGSSVYVSVSTAALQDASGRMVGSMALMADITEKRRAEEFRQHYLHTVSHDLRNPLTTILWNAELLQLPPHGDTLGELERNGIRSIVRACGTMDALIRDLVDSARQEAGTIELHRQPVQLGGFLSELIESAAGSLDTGRIRLSLATGLPPADADPDRLERILVNLLSNALKYSPASAAVEVDVTLGEEEELVISIRDHGDGIAAVDLPRLFERYFRTESGRRSGGLGLGLHITRTLVEAHGGRVRAESTPGVGSTFSFTLPVAAVEGAAA